MVNFLLADAVDEEAEPLDDVDEEGELLQAAKLNDMASASIRDNAFFTINPPSKFGLLVLTKRLVIYELISIFR